MCSCSMCCRKISELMLDEGAPMASPSVWTCMCCLKEKKFCLVMASYHVSSSCLMLGSTVLFSKVLLRMCLISTIGMLEYMFEMAGEADM
jgi:hypothetical protein